MRKSIRFEVIDPVQSRSGRRIVSAFEIILDRSETVPGKPWRLEFAGVHTDGSREVRQAVHEAEFEFAVCRFDGLVERCRANADIREIADDLQVI